jgi:hypothetical protein
MATGMPPVKYQLITLQGGLDLVTPTLSLPPGVAKDASNFEVSITGGYSRIPGYERFDGRPNPSDATYTSMTVASVSGLTVGNTITNLTSSVSGVIIVIDGLSVFYTKVVGGGFILGDTIFVGASAVTTVTSLGATASVNDSQLAHYTYLAAEQYRSDITAVPGSGPIRGVVYLHAADVYAWRNNAAGTAMAIYKSSTSGWTLVPLGYELQFNTGTGEIFEGNTIVGQTSGATAVVTRVAVSSGTWLAGTAAGYINFASVTGNFSAGENIRVGGVTKALAVAAQVAITLTAAGRVECVIDDFGGGSKIYGADGFNYGFEFDGTVYTRIRTGMTTDTPNHVVVHKQHLFFSFANSVQFSGISDQYNWSPVIGAGEIAMNDEVTAFIVQPGNQSTGALAIYTDNNTSILYGTSSVNFQLVSFNVGTGAKAYTCQNLNASYSFDDRGVINMATTLNYGNFDSASLTMNIRPFIQQHRTLATASGVNREKGQYRVFFSDGTALYVTLSNGQYLGTMPMQFPNAVACMTEGEKADGSETSFFGSTNGFVYRLDVGTSFDGEAIPANLTLVFNAIGSPRLLKRFRKGSIEVNGNGYAEFVFGYDLAYGTTEIGQESAATYSIDLAASYWDTAYWDNFVWDGRSLAPSEVEVKGTAENIAVKIASNSAEYQAFTINTIILHYTPRRGLR